VKEKIVQSKQISEPLKDISKIDNHEALTYFD
jgi:hypothetical protein